MKEKLIKNHSQIPEKVISLNIPDNYNKNDPELESILRRELYFYLLNKSKI